ncbi:hypothetical protein FCR2A7T_04540 [Flavobacterium cauense R2A-7]|uniref:Uncharacterized protein n=1 Tax=Flavobacterium cauense R2A-7 TaxID=1341154 RepID=V6S6F1_9FLAO|nr:DUF6427 family protein [Flavobacterium cauense]ESU21989.1 hypothetical protein FCR2A7T_04540 [Flavobacterium cauense R2A-7]KGO81345.1 hypothetical protein Q762_08995 [Flavobacterium cauense R2A-7]TWI13205.1 hypothetical protein IP98_01187 [Flavobacterium cauense R2A-7]
MIASLFNKSRPINYVLISLLLIVFYFLYLTKDFSWTEYYFTIVQKTGLLLVLIASLFLVRFITKRNGLSKDNSYAAFLFFIFLILFPTTLVNSNIILANFFLLLALRRLISMQSLVTPKEKIFDASFWIFVASLFHFWCILFLILVFISIVFHVSRDYRNWLIPFIAFFAVLVLFILAVLLIDRNLLGFVADKIQISFDFTYFENTFQNIALAFFSSVAVLFFATQVLALQNRPLNMQSSYKKILFTFLLGVAVYVLSASKNNSFLMVTFFPLSVLGTNFLEGLDNKWVKESVLGGLVLISLIIFFGQL